MKLNEISGNDQLKAAFTKALDAAITKYADDFEGDKAEAAKTALLNKFDPNLNKGQLTTALKNLGVGEEGTMTSDQIAQFLINQTQKFYNTPASK